MKKTRGKKSRDTVPLSFNILNVRQTVITHIIISQKTDFVITLADICRLPVQQGGGGWGVGGEYYKISNTSYEAKNK
jgi:hypothetical protein